MLYKEYLSMNTWNEMWQGIFENFDPAKISAEDAGKVTQQADKFVKTEALSTLSEDFRIEENIVEHHLPLLRLREKIQTDVSDLGGQVRILPHGDTSLKRLQKLLHPREVVENKAGTLVVILDFDWFSDIRPEQREADAGLRKDPEPVLHH